MQKILMVLTSHRALGNTGRETGFYLSEAAHPYAVFTQAGYEIDFMSPAGGQPPMDGVDLADPLQKSFLDDSVVAEKLQQTLTPDQVNPAEYTAIFYAGGHGVMWDFPDNNQLAQIAATIYEGKGVVAAVCHGPAGLVNVTLSDGAYLVAGKTIATFTNEEEAAVELTDIVPFLLETQLGERGAQITKAPNFEPHVAVSERVVTGQNPASATPVAEAVVEVLSQRAVGV
ncbi:MAG: type 1 glutamine amidotransferase domain-containing protein [Chloroflexi bacterium AL-W]|nr:type 1 glutamine amidotransferase domain-containing protein [Chloroflexi bacterium AL-N1]NOK67657.1 type 1 glutamine amidotransferase domain-containing protein [Chloroflexi bacterium AL-N10]NOK75573.1 type 1 glutamine amidotransferase domain-containing protein [Chloroflexi bacterium AL-N5]NOK82361.1 type 1 glutamine amidotransferase domain-containing protein [Chloroflexi bacterium AL-W]NOK90206.1 type 1 glutamine amidotransferase domain-containing protein [Chloroflexi bacterium AL-N15]